MNFSERLADVLSWRDGSTPLSTVIERVPRVDAIDAPVGTVVVVRADVDVPIADGRVTDDVRLRSCVPTLAHARERGWITIVIGHIGRNPATTLEPVADALGSLIGTDVSFVPDWLEDDTVSDSLRAAVVAASPGSVILCENARKYDLEIALWDARDVSDSALVSRAEKASTSFAELASVFVNEAIAASNPDFSSAALPLAFESAALGFYLHEELADHMQSALTADFVVFSGVKANKLDDLELVIQRDGVRQVVVAGALAAGIVKAIDPDATLGRAETDPTYIGYVSPERMAQSARIVEHCRSAGIELFAPIDFVLADGAVVGRDLAPNAAQLDVGPRTSGELQRIVDAYLATTGRRVLFYNGVFGLFEDPKFEAGTRAFVERLRDLTEAGVLTYVGGGEGRAALLKYGAETDVTHAFTAGGTVLKLLGGRNIPYLRALVAVNTAS